MRGLNRTEEEALLLILEHTTGAHACGNCWVNELGGPDFSLDETLIARLVERGLIYLVPCDDVFGDNHAYITNAGRLVLSLVRLARAA
jgi:hypothetical protein